MNTKEKKNLNSKGELIVADSLFRVTQLYFLSKRITDAPLPYRTTEERLKHFRKYYGYHKRKGNNFEGRTLN